MESGKRVSDELSAAIVALRDAGVDCPQLDAQLMLARALGCSRLDIIAHPERILLKPEVASFHSMLERRVCRYPIAYLLGEKDFFGLTFEVTPSVLIPRPETETLVERVLSQVSDGASIVDVGTGSGAIAVALAVNLPHSQILATDTSEQALKVARANAEKHAVSERVRMVQGDLLDPFVQAGERFDAVVSNPPYIPSSMIPALEPEVRAEPLAALDGGDDGLDVYRKLLPQAAMCTGLVVVEFGIGQEGSIADIARAAGFARVEVFPDLAGIERIAVARR